MQELKIGLEGSVEVGFVAGQAVESGGFEGEGGADFVVAWQVDAGVGKGLVDDGVFADFFVGEAEFIDAGVDHFGFDAAEAFKAPGGRDDLVGDVALEVGGGFEILQQCGAEFEVGEFGLAGDDEVGGVLAAEAVFDGVSG